MGNLDVKAMIDNMMNNLSLPTLNLDDLHKELDAYYEITIDKNLNTGEIKQLFPELQNKKSRVAQILVDASRAYKGRKTALDTLTSIVIKNADPSVYKNREMREGLAAEKLSDFILEVQNYEFLKDNAEMCFENLNDMVNVVSREVTVMQIELQLGELSRGPNLRKDSDFNNSAYEEQEESEEEDFAVSGDEEDDVLKDILES